MGRHSSSSVSQGSALVLVLLAATASAIDISRLPGHRHYTKRSGEVGSRLNGPYLLYLLNNPDNMHAAERECMAYEPFRCPGGQVCISIQYLCDGAPDCPDGYDENPKLCTAAKRPPVEETASFLQSLLASHGPNYLEKLFGSKARNALQPLGGVEAVAVALSESQTIDSFGDTLHLMRSDVEHLRSVFMAVENGDIGMLKSLGIKDSELGDVKFFLEKLVNTGFLD
ncbi:prohormone-4 isoform X2 [Cherax quadricarinatus]|uniref:prohormone-4 isoform X2 n=1 Tax=Cherax quadricarinatus TaxID=27406 RepID=UPI0023782EF5|nr:prohormone-4-like isoform X2 [Cherax quadricarinatus]